MDRRGSQCLPEGLTLQAASALVALGRERGGGKVVGQAEAGGTLRGAMSSCVAGPSGSGKGKAFAGNLNKRMALAVAQKITGKLLNFRARSEGRTFLVSTLQLGQDNLFSNILV